MYKKISVLLLLEPNKYYINKTIFFENFNNS